MTNNYNIILVAGSRINGAVKYTNTAEELQHHSIIAELQNELGSFDYHDNLGFITAELTDEQFNTCMNDNRIFSITPVSEVSNRSNITNYDTVTNNQWNLRQLSNRLNKQSYILSGFDISLKQTTVGIGTDSIQISYSIMFNSLLNKVMHNEVFYNYEIDYTYTVCHIDNLTSLPLNVPMYIGYDYSLELVVLSVTTYSTLIPIYTVELSLYKDPITLFYVGPSGSIGFVNLTPIDNITYDTVLEGAGVDIIISDALVNTTLPEFDTRATVGFTDEAAGDHGTSVASVAAGNTCGIARKANIIGVAYTNKNNTALASLNWIIGHVNTKRLTGKPYPVVVNMSWGTAANVIDQALDSACASLLSDNITVVIAAGNDGLPFNSSPYDPRAILVGATDINIKTTYFSEYGPQISVFAPGADIRLLLYDGNYAREDGTSFAAPAVAGLCAIYLGLHPEADIVEIKNAIINAAIPVVTYNREATTNLFAQCPYYGLLDKTTFDTPVLNDNLIYSIIPYIIGFDDKPVYGSKHELTLNKISSAVLSAGKTESVDLAISIELQP